MTQESFVAQRSSKREKRKKERKNEILTKIKSDLPACRNSAEQREGPGGHGKRGAWDREEGPGPAAAWSGQWVPASSHQCSERSFLFDWDSRSLTSLQQNWPPFYNLRTRGRAIRSLSLLTCKMGLIIARLPLP